MRKNAFFGTVTLLLIGISVFFSGCRQKGNTEAESISFAEVHNGISAFPGGILCKGANTKRMYVLDYETKELIPLCSRPDCDHATGEKGYNENCIASLLYWEASFGAVKYGDKLWYLRGEDDQETMSICSSDLNGENRISHGQIRAGIAATGSVIYRNGQVYLSSYFWEWSELQEFLGLQSKISAYSLEDRKETVIEPMVEGEAPVYEILGADDTSLYYKSQEKENGLRIWKYDFDSGEKEEVSLETEGEVTACQMGTGGLAYSSGESGFFYSFQTGESVRMREAQEPILGYTVLDGEVYFYEGNAGWFRYDIADKELTKIREGDLDDGFMLVSSFDDSYLILSNQDGLCWIEKDMFVKGGKMNILEPTK